MSDFHSLSLTQPWSLTKSTAKKEQHTFQLNDSGTQKQWSDIQQNAIDSLLEQQSEPFDLPKQPTEFQPVLDFLPFDTMLLSNQQQQQQQDDPLTADHLDQLFPSHTSLNRKQAKSMMHYFDEQDQFTKSMTTLPQVPDSSYNHATPYSYCATSVHQIQSYLCQESAEKTVIVMTSKVAQKSYGTEKRFLCPPPTAILVGSSWWTTADPKKTITFQAKDQHHYGPPLMTVCISGDNSESQLGRIEWYDGLGTVIGQTGGMTQKSTGGKKQVHEFTCFDKTNLDKHTTDDWYQNNRQTALAGGRCVLKRLYINDSDEKRKRVECLVKLQLADGYQLGIASSRAIKVISKPSKKRQSVKNVELCIYHGTAVSLFNRIRSQTVSTKYLGVSSTLGEASLFDYPGRHSSQAHPNADTCFVARAGSWDPFVVWIVDPHPDAQNSSTDIDDYIGSPTLSPTMPYPNPPTIALKNRSGQPLAVRYNQHIVLQCLTTGLVSPVMIIRKVDKASTVVGGARCPEGLDASLSGGGEMGDEILGDPVSQLHKVALQIVQPEPLDASSSPADPHPWMPQTRQSQATYLACLNDLVGTHKTTNRRSPIKSAPHLFNSPSLPECYTSDPSTRKHTLSKNVCPEPFYSFEPESSYSSARRRVSSVSDTHRIQSSILPYPNPSMLLQRSHSISTPSTAYQDLGLRSMQRRSSNSSVTHAQALAEYGAYWNEAISDTAVWTIVGTDCAIYHVWTPPHLTQQQEQEGASTFKLFPYLTHISVAREAEQQDLGRMLTLSGESLSRDLHVWFGDIEAVYTEYKSRDMIICGIPEREHLLQSMSLTRKDNKYSIRILLTRKDGVIYKTNQVYSFH